MKIKGDTLLTVTLGNVVNVAIGYAASYVLFTFFVVTLGPIIGLIVSWIISFIVFYCMILFYAWTKKDWIGIEKFKENIKKETGTSLISKMLIYANRKGEKLFFIALSIKLGPFTSLMYMRDPHDYSKMQRKDWRIFLLGYLITNLFCSVVVLLGIFIYKNI